MSSTPPPPTPAPAGGPGSFAIASPPYPDAVASAGEAPAPVALLVDDEKNIRRTLRMVLEGEGYQVQEADSAATAEQSSTST